MSLDAGRQDWITSLRRFAGFRGQTAFELGEIVTPTIELGAADAPFHSKRGGISSAQQIAVAAQQSYVGLQLPLANVDQGTRIVVRLIRCFTAAAAALLKVGPVNNTNAVVAALATVIAANSWDTKNEDGTGVVIPPAGRVVSGSSATNVHTNGGSMLMPLPLTPSFIDVPLDFVLAPGATLLVQTGGVNQELDVAFYWDEYTIT